MSREPKPIVMSRWVPILEILAALLAAMWGLVASW